MASIHVATMVFKRVLPNGTVIADDATNTDRMHASTELRVNEDADIPNSAGFPTLKAYLEAEATSNFVANHIDQTYVVTYGS